MVRKVGRFDGRLVESCGGAGCQFYSVEPVSQTISCNRKPAAVSREEVSLKCLAWASSLLFLIVEAVNRCTKKHLP